MNKIFMGMVCLVVTGVTVPSKASVLLQHSPFVVGNIGSNFADAGGTPTDGMSWGILVDTNSDGFAGGSYEPFALTTNQFLSSGGAPSDDYWVLSSNVTFDSTGLLEDDLSTTGGPGTIGDISVPHADSSSSPVSTGFGYALLWFSNVGDTSASVGDTYGLFSDPSFTIPSDGATVDRSLVFDGPDPIRSASFTVIPEPSSLLLLTISLLGAVFFSRRRRSISE